MKVEIANPIYDVVFKYMMEDNAVAKLMVSSIIGEEIISLDPNPQERTVEKKDEKSNQTLTVYRLDYAAKIKTPEGQKLIIIELQKASLPSDIMRFRGYLGNQYADKNNSITREDGSTEALPIYTIYFLGDELGIRRTPVLKVFPCVIDMGDQQIIDAKSEFIDSLNHHSWIVQISCMQEPRRNELELLLSVFDQNNRTSDNHILNVREEDFPEKYRPLIRRLKQASTDPEVKKQMKAEDDVFDYMKMLERMSAYKAAAEERMKWETDMAKKDEELVKKDQQLNAERKKSEAAQAESEAAQAKMEAAQAEKEAAQAEKEAQMKSFVIKCHHAGFEMDTISNITGLTPQQITEILQQAGLV